MSNVTITSMTARPRNVDVPNCGSATVSVGIFSSGGDTNVDLVYFLDDQSCVYFENGLKESGPYPGVATTLGAAVVTPLTFECGEGAASMMFPLTVKVSASGNEEGERSIYLVNAGGPCP